MDLENDAGRDLKLGVAGYVAVAAQLSTATQDCLHISTQTLGNPLSLHMENYSYFACTHKLLACFRLFLLFQYSGFNFPCTIFSLSISQYIHY